MLVGSSNICSIPIDVRVSVLSIYSGHQVRWMYQPGSQQEEGHTGFIIHLLSAVHAFIFLVDREVEFCVLTIESFSTCWAFLFIFIFIIFYF